MTIKRGIRLTEGPWLLLLLAVAGTAAVAGCGGEDRLSREEFENRLQSIDRRESERFGQLAQRVRRLKPDQTLPADVRQGMRDVAAGNRRAADELDELNPPEDAANATDALIEALRERARGFEQATRRKPITFRELEAEGSITKAGEKIDRAFERLRREGFLPEEKDHSEE